MKLNKKEFLLGAFSGYLGFILIGFISFVTGFYNKWFIIFFVVIYSLVFVDMFRPVFYPKKMPLNNNNKN